MASKASLQIQQQGGVQLTSYRYVFGTLRDEKIIAEIPLYGTYMDLELNAGGRFDGNFSLDMTGYDNQVLLDATIPGRCFVVVERDDKPIWGGFVWSRTFQSQSKNVQIYAQSFENYPQYQLVRSSFSRSSDEQLDIFHELWTHMQAVDGRDINIIAELNAHEVVVRKTVEVLASDYKFYYEIMSSLSDASDGFDWIIDIFKDGPSYRKVLRTGYPTLGTPDPSNLIIEYPGAILNYYATESMSVSGTNVFTLGSGEGSAMVFKQTTQTQLVNLGFPRWDYVSSHKDVEKQALIDTIANKEKVARKPPMMVIKPTIKAGRPDVVTPDFSSFGLGDACRLVIRDSRFPSGFNFDTRIIKWALKPQQNESTEEYTLLFQGDEEG